MTTRGEKGFEERGNKTLVKGKQKGDYWGGRRQAGRRKERRENINKTNYALNAIMKLIPLYITLKIKISFIGTGKIAQCANCLSCKPEI